MPEVVWAPWRLAYIERATPQGGCIFVDLPAEGKDRENLILWRGKTGFVMLNAHPYSNGHLMVAPYRHTAEIGELNEDELLEIQVLIAACVRWLRTAYGPEGFNLGCNMGKVAGAGIPDHIHWHVVPRWNGDTNFMTSIAEVRVLPQSLADSYDRLHAIAQEDPA